MIEVDLYLNDDILLSSAHLVQFLSSYRVNMGNLPAKRGEQSSQQSPLQTPPSSTQLSDSIKDKIDPLSIFGLKEYTKQETLAFLTSPAFIQRYHSLMRQYHPDRGGSTTHCSMIQYSFETLKHARDNYISFADDREKDGNELRNES